MLVGTIVGAGILGIPYVIAKAGFLYGLGLIVALGVVILFVNLFMGEVVLRTKKQHQLTGYAEKYLGKWGKRIMLFSMLISLYGALTAYLIGEGQTLFSIFKFGSPLLYSLVFFIITSIIIYSGIKATGKAELYLILLLTLVVAAIGIFSFDKIQFSNFSAFNPAYLFLPYGVVLFAYLGAPAIPEMQEEIGKHKKLMKKAIVFGSIAPVVLYLIFTIIIVGVIGLPNFELLAPNERIATVALSMYSHPLLGLLANFLAVLAMFTSYLTIGMALFQMYHYDFSITKTTSLSLISLPLIIVLFDITSFIAVVGATGAIAGGLEGILIVLMYWKSKLLGDRKPEYQLPKHKLIGTIIILVFLLGVLQQLFAKFFFS